MIKELKIIDKKQYVKDILKDYKSIIISFFILFIISIAFICVIYSFLDIEFVFAFVAIAGLANYFFLRCECVGFLKLLWDVKHDDFVVSYEPVDDMYKCPDTTDWTYYLKFRRHRRMSVSEEEYLQTHIGDMYYIVSFSTGDVLFYPESKYRLESNE